MTYGGVGIIQTRISLFGNKGNIERLGLKLRRRKVSMDRNKNWRGSSGKISDHLDHIQLHI